MIECHVREVENLPDAFALVVQDGKFLVAVRRGLVPRKDVDLLDRLLKRGLSELLQMPNLALTS